MSRETILRQYLDTLKGQYSHILIDCQPSLVMLCLLYTSLGMRRCIADGYRCTADRKFLLRISQAAQSLSLIHISRDEAGRLLCGAAVGATPDVLERVAELIKAQVDVIVLDSAHGHNNNRCV